MQVEANQYTTRTDCDSSKNKAKEAKVGENKPPKKMNELGKKHFQNINYINLKHRSNDSTKGNSEKVKKILNEDSKMKQQTKSRENSQICSPGAV